MTVQGTAGKTFVLLGHLGSHGDMVVEARCAVEMVAFGVVAISGIGGFITAMITIFKPTSAPATAPDLCGV